MGAYIGQEPKASAIVRQGSGTGDGSTVVFNMGFSARADNEVIVTLDGVVQHTSAYSISVSTCTFSAAPASAVAIEFRIAQSLGFVAEVGDGTVNQNKIDTSSLSPIVQLVREERLDTTTHTSNTIPFDDTIPQNTEGHEYDTVTITPTKVGNLLVIEYDIQCNMSSAGTLTTALFKDSDTDAIGAHIHGYQPAANAYRSVKGRFGYIATSTSAITFKIRLGNNVSNTLYINSDVTSRRMGGVLTSWMQVTEIAQ